MEDVMPHKENGFALLQALIAGVMMAGISMVLWQLVHNSSMTEKNIRVETEVLDVLDSISHTMMNPQACMRTLLFSGASLTQDSLPIKLQGVVNEQGDNILRIDELLAANQLQFKEMSLNKVDDFVVNGLITAQLRFTFLKKFSGAGSKTITRKFNLTLETDSAKKVKSCSSLDKIELETVRTQVCQDIGGTMVAGECKGSEKLRETVCDSLGLTSNGSHCQ